jgi:hypothetical protein
MSKYTLKSLTPQRLKLFWKNVDKASTCWIWTGQLDNKLPYGIFAGMRAHRLSWMIENKSDWPTGKIARHTCHNYSCVNPNHIIPGTYKENWEDSRQTHLDAFKKIDPEHWKKEGIKRQKSVKTPYGIFNSVKEAKSAIGGSPNTIHKYLKTPNSGYEYI